MKIISLGIVWNWELDADFIYHLEQCCTRHHLTSYRVEQHNLTETIHLIRSGKLFFSALFDRASDADENFEPLSRLCKKVGTHLINPLELIHFARDKATMHLELISAGLNVPFTIIISPYNKKKEVELSLSELAKLGRPFIIKPANTTGGGVGVVLGAESLKDVIETRQHNKNDKYLLQEKIVPAVLDAHRAWFRCFFAFGKIILCWWDDQTHVYRTVTPEENNRYSLGRIHRAMKKIHSVCQLQFFSSEFALTTSDSLIVIDYVNEVCDMRRQANFPDGVPDDIVNQIQELIVREVKRRG